MEPAILAEITRGSIVESRHRGAVAVVTADGKLVASAGNIDFVTYLRSAAKPHQAVALITSGAARRFEITSRELALICGSHSGEPYHVECVSALLTRLGLERSALRCGIHTPFSRAVARALGSTGVTELHNNCSGKHVGMLAQAVHRGYTLDDYYAIDHPVQRYIASVLSEFVDLEPGQLITAIDGCSAATFAMTVRQMALIYARLVNPVDLRGELAGAARQVVDAMLQHPEMVAADTGRIDTDLIRLMKGSAIAKAGAEGVYAIGVLPCKRYPQGLGIAIKVEDGDVNRARNAAILATLVQLELIDSRQTAALSAQYLAPLKNNSGLLVGEILPRVKLTFC
ncbi:MAG: asparaginase [Acidobacteriota bacterium]|nr:asparaginase [Blastocatellia bacterium]MDW8411200.1 asparaginase [Acidobacteriota bacterium]